MADEAPKTAYELAMERLRKKDADAGVPERSVTDEQRAQIAEVRRVYQARLAEREIAHHGARRNAADPEALAKVDEEYHRERDRLNAERDLKIEKIRGE